MHSIKSHSCQFYRLFFLLPIHCTHIQTRFATFSYRAKWKWIFKFFSCSSQQPHGILCCLLFCFIDFGAFITIWCGCSLLPNRIRLSIICNLKSKPCAQRWIQNHFFLLLNNQTKRKFKAYKKFATKKDRHLCNTLFFMKIKIILSETLVCDHLKACNSFLYKI